MKIRDIVDAVKRAIGEPTPAPAQKVSAHFAAYRLADGKVVARLEFSKDCSTDAIVETTRKVMTRMVGPFSDDANVEGGMLHCHFASCCANVETQKQSDGGTDVLWFFHKNPPADSELMVLLSATVGAAMTDRKAMN